MQKTISLTWNPKEWTAEWGGSKPKQAFAFLAQKVHSEIHPVLEKK